MASDISHSTSHQSIHSIVSQKYRTGHDASLGSFRCATDGVSLAAPIIEEDDVRSEDSGEDEDLHIAMRPRGPQGVALGKPESESDGEDEDEFLAMPQRSRSQHTRSETIDGGARLPGAGLMMAASKATQVSALHRSATVGTTNRPSIRGPRNRQPRENIFEI